MPLQHLARRSTAGVIAGLVRGVCGASVTTAVQFLDGRPKIFYGNHSSHLDFLIIWATLPPLLRLRTRPVVAQDYWLRSRPREFLSRQVFRAIFVDRGRTTRANNPLREVESAVAAGESIVVFPEGNRSGDGKTVRPFRSGLYHIAKRCRSAEIVPVYLENMNRILPKGEILIVPLLSAVRYGTPISLERGESRPAFLERARRHLEETAK